jgi:lysophospholipase L1-like esterase
MNFEFVRAWIVRAAASGCLLTGALAHASDLLYFSTLNDTAVPGVPAPFDDADVYRYDVATGQYDRVFDARNAGLPSIADVDALHVVDPVTFILSFRADAGTAVPGLGTVMDEDVVIYHAGRFAWYLRGLDVGLGDNGGAEDIDAIDAPGGGSLLISTVGAPKVGVTGARPHDVLRCDGSFGPAASCSWAMHLDGSAVGLSTANENLDVLFGRGGDLHFGTKGPFNVRGLAGGRSDVARCHEASGGPPVSCASFTKFFDGDAAGLTDKLDAGDFAADAFADPDPAEFRVVVLGSSTAVGAGASEPAMSWVGRLDAWLGTVAASHEVVNLAENAHATYSYRADGATPQPDPNHSITRALELNPDVIILNFPSHNIADGIPTATTISHYQEMKAAADLRGVPLFLTTTQPRNFGTLAQRSLLRDEAIAVRAEFGELVIDVYDELTNFGNLRLKAAYNSGDGVHLNDAGHGYLFETVRDKIAPLVTP